MIRGFRWQHRDGQWFLVRGVDGLEVATVYPATIEYTHYTFSPWKCDGDNRIVASESQWKKPLKWDRAAKKAGERHRVYCDVDAFEDWGGAMVDAKGAELGNRENDGPLTMQNVRERLFDLIDSTPNLNWLLPTKWPENIARMMPPVTTNMRVVEEMKAKGEWHGEGHRPNVWLGASVEGRKHGVPRIDVLRDIPAAVRFLSVEPLLEDLGQINLSGIDWVIVGGESGLGARPMHPDWVRSIRDQCQAAGVPFFFKQWGDYCPEEMRVFRNQGEYIRLMNGELVKPDYLLAHKWSDGIVSVRVGKKAAGRLLDGREWDELPKGTQ